MHHVAEPNDSAEVREFMAVFQKLRVLIDDSPELLESEAADNEPLTNLCMDVWNAAYSLHMAERSARQLFTAPTNPEFVTHWRDYEARYRLPLGNIAFLNAFGAAPAPAVVAAREKSHWEIVASGAAANAKAIRATVEHARIDAETFAQTGLYSEDYQDEVYAGVDAWNSLIDEAGFDLEGVLRRRALVPFTLVPRHVSQRHGEAETLSLLTSFATGARRFRLRRPVRRARPNARNLGSRLEGTLQFCRRGFGSSLKGVGKSEFGGGLAIAHKGSRLA